MCHTTDRWQKDRPYHAKTCRYSQNHLCCKKAILPESSNKCYKIVFRLINVDFHTFFRLAPSNNTRGHRYKLFVEQSTHNVRYYFFSSRVVNVWNHSPFDTDFSSLVRFKAALKRTDSWKFLTYCTD